jgi:hypothetical protein
MSAPRHLYGVGATKAGTSWLYRALHDHPGCALKAVKEMHYWDTFDAGVRDRQVAAFGQRLAEIRARMVQAEGVDWQLANLRRRARDTEALIAMVQADRTGDAAYLAFMADGANGRLVADITPGYGLLSEARLRAMVAAAPGARWVYLIRDPLDRLWSHVRMQAGRQAASGPQGADFEARANAILGRIVNRGEETHILMRGDYAAAVARLARVVPADRLKVEFCERLFTAQGWAQMCGFLGLPVTQVATGTKEHAGTPARMRPALRDGALAMLIEHYDWAAREMGPLPDAWQRNRAEASA